jgi:hypothetical protein
MRSRQQYLNELRREYIGASKSAKTQLLQEAQKRTGLSRKHLISKLRPEAQPVVRPRRARRPTYDGVVRSALARIWELFDYPCGQRLVVILREQVERLRRLGELRCSTQVAEKLQRISAKTIDRLLGRERERLRLKRYRNPAVHPLLYQQIPVKVPNQWDRSQVGNLQLDFVFHCGQSGAGQFIYTLSVADIASGWWEARALLGRSQHATLHALDQIRQLLPFRMLEIHPDNDGCLINQLIWKWCRQHRIQMSRSRPLHKNDNAWVEQRNWSHVRKMVGYRRFDTQVQMELLNSLYQDLILFKNFFQPLLKLAGKRRVRGKVHRQYEPPATPYQRLLDSQQLSPAASQHLRKLYESLNPAELKRGIDAKRDLLMATFENSAPKQPVPTRKMVPRLVRFFMTQPKELWLGS